MGQFKRLGFQRKKAGLTHEQFVAHWVNVHAQMAKHLPGLRRYSVNVIDRTRFPNFGYDGFSELWFDSEAACAAAFASPMGVALLADLQNYVENVEAVFVEEYPIVWP
ncbi:MAG: EthD family reductase [Proteobacteria bacterium]|nr:MAG: EthD family reductase [Pseudomonadota bacterium]